MKDEAEKEEDLLGVGSMAKEDIAVINDFFWKVDWKRPWHEIVSMSPDQIMRPSNAK